MSYKQINDLLAAIDAWGQADSALADRCCRENEYRWDDAKSLVEALADELRQTVELRSKISDFLEAKRQLIERDARMYCNTVLKHTDEISYAVNATDEIIGGRAWVDDPYCHYCVTDKFVFATHGDTVVASELFADATQDALVAFFADRFRSEQRR